MNKNTGGPAFPAEVELENCHYSSTRHEEGMSLRDYFAGKALQGWLAADMECGPDTAPIIAANAYLMADAMIAERAK